MSSDVIRVSGYDVEINYGYDFDALQSRWLAVQSNRDVPFFLTWSWISCWIKTYNPKIIVVSAYYNGSVVAIGLFTCSFESRHGFIKSCQYRLHQMGDALLDQIWMEYNDFIALGAHQEAAVNACIQALAISDRKWDEIIFSMMAASRADSVLKNFDNTQVLATNTCYAVDLDDIEQRYTHYLDSLHANTRYQIRRSMRLYEQLHGKPVLTRAESIAEALHFFDEAGGYHIQRWVDSGYKNPKFILFHKNLIAHAFKDKSIELLKISAGETVIAILYFHVVNRNVFFYLQGLNYEKNPKLKPGLVAHALATEFFISLGMSRYDYMGGDSQYKRQLAARTEDLVSICIQRPSLKFSVENFGRDIKSMAKNNGETCGE